MLKTDIVVCEGFVEAVKGCDFVGFSKGRVVKNVPDQSLHIPTKGHNHLAEVNELTGGAANNVNAINFKGLWTKTNL
jgi:hypothetical protein